MMRLLVIISVLVLSTSLAWAQQRTIKGRLISEDDKTPIPGWNVIEPGTTNGTVTDINGEFLLTVSSGPAIVWFPQCFTQLYVEYDGGVNFRKIVLGGKDIMKESKELEQKLSRAKPTRDLWGEVIDKESKKPVDGCEVRVKGTDEVVYTDGKGSFMITVPNNMITELEIRKEPRLQTVTYDRNEDFKRIKFK